MGWGDAFASAWDAASDAAQSAAQTVANTAKAAANYVADAASNAIDIAVHAAKTAASAIVGVARDIVDMAAKAVGAVWKFFKKVAAGVGSLIKQCPYAGGGGGAAPGGGATPGGGSGADDPDEDDDINIVSIDWLDGTDEKIIKDCEQFVNLPRDAKWLADSGIANIDRLSINPRFLVKFDKPKSAGFQWCLVPVPSTSPAYSKGAADKEEERNPAGFVPSELEWSSSSVTEGKAVMENAAKLVAGGGYKFKLKARDDKGKVVESGVITTKRLFWYVELPMTGMTSALSSTATMDAEFAKYHMVLKQMPDLSIPHQENIGNNADKTTLEGNIAAALTGSPATSGKAPYLVKIAYTDHLGVKHANVRQRLENVDVGPGKGSTTIDIYADGLLAPHTNDQAPLWHSIVTGEGWFCSATYTPNDGSAAVDIPPAKVTAPAGNWKYTVDVDLESLPAGRGTIDVYVNVVDRMRAGLALSGNANICICTRAYWRTETDADQIGVAIHELGHIVSQCTTGTGIEPDASATQYTGHGHAGSHCHKGCPDGEPDYGTDANVTASQCVMFGTSNGKTAFCGNCAPGMYKVDIGAGF